MWRPRLLPLLSAVWFAAILASFHLGPEGFPPYRLAGLLYDLLLLALVAAAAWGLGSALLGPLKLADESPREAPLFEVGAGLGVLALAIFAVAAAGILHRWVILILLAAGTLLLLRRRAWIRSATAADEGRWSRGEIAVGVLPLLSGAMTLACSLAPPEFYDALVYHLAVPDLYLRNHGMVPVPDNFYAGYPANMGMLYAVGLALGGGGPAQAIHWLCGALSAASLFACARRHTDRRTALVACALFCLAPGVMLASTYAIADLGVTLFGTLCLASVLNLWKSGRRRWAVAAALFAGLALGTKYTAAVVICAPAAAAILLRPAVGAEAGRSRRAPLLDLALFAGIAFLLVAPWLARNAVYAGNPLAPYLSSGGEGAGATPDIDDEMRRRLPLGAGPAGLAWHYLAAPWNVTMKRTGAAGYLGAAFLLLVPPLIFMRGLPPAAVPLSLMGGMGFAGWALSSQVGRYLFPVLPALALLAAVSARRLPRAVVLPALGWSLLYNALLFVLLVETAGTYRVVTGAETPDEYLSRRVSYYPAMVFLEKESPPDAKVLFVGEGRGFYCPRAYAASTPFDAPILDAYAAAAGAETALLRRLRREGFTHLLVSGPELRRTRGIGADDVMRRFFPSGEPRLLFEKHDVRVYALPG